MAIPLTLADALLTIPIIEAPNFNATFFGSQQATPSTAAFVSTAALEEMKRRPPPPPPPPQPPAARNDSDEDGGMEEGEGRVRTPKRRLNYTLEFKNKVIQYAERTNNCQAAIKYNVPRQCIQRWRQIKPELEELMQGTPHSSKKKRLGGGGRPLKNVELDEKLDLWLKAKIRERGTKITGKMIKEYAISIAGNDSFKASNGWLQRFMIRHGLAAPPAPRNAPPTPEESPRSSPEPEPTPEEAQEDPPASEQRKSTRTRQKPQKHSPEADETPRRSSLRNLQKPVGVASNEEEEGGVAVDAAMGGVIPDELQFDGMTEFMEAYRNAGGNPEDAEVVALLATLHHERGVGLAQGAGPARGAEFRDGRKEEPAAAKEAEPRNGAERPVPTDKNEGAGLPVSTIKDEGAESKKAELPVEAAKDEGAGPAHTKKKRDLSEGSKKKEAELPEKRAAPTKKRAEPEEVGDTDSSTSSSDDNSSSSSDSSDEE